MTFSISLVAESLAAYLAPLFPGVIFYEDPNQQDSQVPCMFLQQRDAEISKQPASRYLRTIQLEITYLEDYNLPNLQQLYLAAAEILDENLETFPFSDGTTIALIRTYDRDWRVDEDGLHYQFAMQLFVTPEKVETPMESIQSATINLNPMEV